MTNEEIQNLILEAESCAKQNKHGQAESLCHSAFEALTKHAFAPNAFINASRARLHYILGTIMLINGRKEEALDTISMGLELTKQEEFSTHKDILNNKALLLNTLGIIYREITDFPNAILCYEEALKINKQLKNEPGIANNMGNLGDIYHSMGNNEKALECFLRNKEYFALRSDTINLAGTISNIGSVYHALNQSEQARQCFEEALALNRETGTQNYECINLNNLADLAREQGEYEKAEQLYKQSLQLATRINFTHLLTTILMKLAYNYMQAAQQEDSYEQANKLFNDALKMASDSKDFEGQFRILYNLAELRERQKFPAEALSYFKRAVAIEKEYLGENANKQLQLLDHRRKIEDAERDRQLKLARFQEQEKILHNILPQQIANRILEGEKQIADDCEEVSVFFCDIVGFTKLSQNITAHELVSMLNEVFSEFDRLAIKHGLEKIKTIGDAYMAVAGLPVAQTDHAERAAHFAFEVMQFIESYRNKSQRTLSLRIGLHCGHAVAGIIGENKFAYDLWGDAVNTASRMESHGENGRIHVSSDFMRHLLNRYAQTKISDHGIIFENRGELEIKGKGLMTTFFMNYQGQNHLNT